MSFKAPWCWTTDTWLGIAAAPIWTWKWRDEDEWCYNLNRQSSPRTLVASTDSATETIKKAWLCAILSQAQARSTLSIHGKKSVDTSRRCTQDYDEDEWVSKKVHNLYDSYDDVDAQYFEEDGNKIIKNTRSSRWRKRSTQSRACTEATVSIELIHAVYVVSFTGSFFLKILFLHLIGCSV